MYIIKQHNKKVTRKSLSFTFDSYDSAKNALRKYLRSIKAYNGGFKQHGYSIEGVK